MRRAGVPRDGSPPPLETQSIAYETEWRSDVYECVYLDRTTGRRGDHWNSDGDALVGFGVGEGAGERNVVYQKPKTDGVSVGLVDGR